MMSHKKRTSLVVSLSLLLSPLYGNAASATKTSLYTQLQNEFPNSYLVQKDETQGLTTQNLADQLDYLKKAFITKPLTPEEQRSIALKVLANDTSNEAPLKNDLLDAAGRKDLELLNQANLHTIINRTDSVMGELALAKMISDPINDVQELNNRQAIVAQFLQDKELFSTADKQLKKLGSTEKTYLTLWQTMDPMKENFLNGLYYFKYLPGAATANKNPYALGASNQFNNLCCGISLAWEPVMLGVVLYLQLKETNKIIANHNAAQPDTTQHAPLATLKDIVRADYDKFMNLPTGTRMYYGFVVAMLMIFKKQLVEVLKIKRDSANYLQTRLIELATALNSLKELNKLIIKNDLKGFEAITTLFSSSNKHSAEFKKLIALLNTNTFKGQASFFSLTGRVLAAHKLVQEVKNELRDALEAAGKLDALLSTAKLLKEFESKRVNYCFAEFVTGDKPYIELNEFWNPLVNPEVVVTNDVKLGGQHTRNMILTGPNTGGKSTVIKGITINVVLAQTLGIAAAKSMKITPVGTVSTNINITDNVKENLSLFAAETARAKHVLDTMEKLGSQFGFCVFDETFRGTAPDQAEKLSVWYAKELAKFDNVICLHATHYPTMINLEHDAKSCKNYKVEIKKSASGALERDYKLKEGSTLFNVAEDILKEQGLIR